MFLLRNFPAICSTRVAAAILLLGLLGACSLSPSTADPAVVSAIRALLTTTQPGIQINDIQPSPVDGLYEVSIQNGQTIYVSDDAKYLIPGDLYQAGGEGLINLGESRPSR
jgi:thiol:disulfide interchange protein DsbC